MVSAVEDESLFTFYRSKLKAYLRYWTVRGSVFSALILIGASPCQAAKWQSATHFGFEMISDSSTGFEDAGGSILLLDLSRTLAGDFASVGLRTTGSGAEGHSAKFYRLATGPLLHLNVFKSWSIEVAAQLFNETATESGKKIYKSRGQIVQFGWQRSMTLSNRISLSWGGFLTRHWGDLRPTSPTTAATTSSANIGNSRGIEVGLRVLL